MHTNCYIHRLDYIENLKELAIAECFLSQYKPSLENSDGAILSIGTVDIVTQCSPRLCPK